MATLTILYIDPHQSRHMYRRIQKCCSTSRHLSSSDVEATATFIPVVRGEDDTCERFGDASVRLHERPAVSGQRQ